MELPSPRQKGKKVSHAKMKRCTMLRISYQQKSRKNEVEADASRNEQVKENE
jgi:hypothetical protein